VSGLAFDRRGERLACAGADRSIRLHAVEDGRPLQRYDPGVGASRSIRFDGDDHLLVLGWWDLSRLDLVSGRRTTELPEIGWSFDRASDGRIVVAPGRAAGVGWRRGRVAWIARAIDGEGRFMAVGPGVGSFDCEGRLVSSLPGLETRRLTLSPDRRLAAIVDSQLELTVVDLATGSIIASAGRVAAGEPRTIAFDASGRHLAFVRPDWSIAILDLDAGGDEESICRGSDPAATEPLAIAFSPDGDRLALGQREGILHIVGRHDGERRALILGTSPFSTLFSPDGRTLAVGTWRGDLFLVDAATGSYRILRGHSAMVNILEQHPTDPEVFLSTGSDGQIRCWHWTLERNLLTLEPFGGRIAMRAAGFTPSGDAILAASVDGDLVRISLSEADRRIERSLDFERARLQRAGSSVVP
jgi:WD40 repeat protein